MGRELLKCVLSEIAASTRELDLAVDELFCLPARPFFCAGKETTLFVGNLDKFVVHDLLPGCTLSLCDEAADRLQNGLARVADTGAHIEKVVLASPDDLRVDLARAEELWAANPPSGFEAASRMLSSLAADGKRNPVLQDESFNTVISTAETVQSIAEVFRVLSSGGIARFLISLSDQTSSADTPITDPHRTETGFFDTWKTLASTALQLRLVRNGQDRFHRGSSGGHML